jgi:hypothetical protein
MTYPPVAQACSLPYRRLVACMSPHTVPPINTVASARCKTLRWSLKLFQQFVTLHAKPLKRLEPRSRAKTTVLLRSAKTLSLKLPTPNGSMIHPRNSPLPVLPLQHLNAPR